MSVVFRRVRGHIVPIQVKDDQSVLTKRQVKGGAAIAAGAAAAAAGGAGAFSLLRKAASYENMSRIAAQSTSGAVQGAKFLTKSKVFHGARNFSILGGALAGGALINQGLKLLGHKKGQEKTTTPEGVSVPASFALASTVAGAVYYGSLLRPRTSAALKKVAELARGRKTLEFIFKGK